MKLVDGAYNRGRQAAILRQFADGEDALWGAGLLPPVGNRIAHAESPWTWGTLNVEKHVDEFVTFCDCVPFSAEAY